MTWVWRSILPCLCQTCIDDPDPGYFDYQYLRVGQTKGVKTLPYPVQPDRQVEVETLLAAIDGPRPKNAADMESMLQEILEHITREESAAEVANNFIKFKPKLLGVEIDGNKVIDKAMALWRKRRKQTG